MRDLIIITGISQNDHVRGRTLDHRRSVGHRQICQTQTCCSADFSKISADIETIAVCEHSKDRAVWRGVPIRIGGARAEGAQLGQMTATEAADTSETTSNKKI